MNTLGTVKKVLFLLALSFGVSFGIVAQAGDQTQFSWDERLTTDTGWGTPGMTHMDKDSGNRPAAKPSKSKTWKWNPKKDAGWNRK